MGTRGAKLRNGKHKGFDRGSWKPKRKIKPVCNVEDQTQKVDRKKERQKEREGMKAASSKCFPNVSSLNTEETSARRNRPIFPPLVTL